MDKFNPHGSMPYAGPMQPVVFIGHFKQSPSDIGNVAHEVFLGFNSFVEGIHVVPNQVTPPGFTFQGRTMPDLRSKRSFTLELHGRVVGTTEIKTLLSVTITGGVQWMALDAAVAALEVDYLAIVGSFESLSIIIHGGATKKDVPNFTPPFPQYYEDFIYPICEGGARRKTDHTSRNRVILDHLTGNRQLLLKTEDVLKTLIADETKLADGLLSTVSMAHSSSRISIDVAVILVEKAFSLNLEQLQSDFETSHKALEEVSNALENCWKVCEIHVCLDCLIFSNFDFADRCTVAGGLQHGGSEEHRGRGGDFAAVSAAHVLFKSFLVVALVLFGGGCGSSGHAHSIRRQLVPFLRRALGTFTLVATPLFLLVC